MHVQHLEPLIGDWTVEIRMPGSGDLIRGTTSFEWLPGGGYIIERSAMENPAFPTGVMVIGPAAGGGRVVQHYFDSRGIARIYEISFEDGELRLWRDDPDFAQRFTGRLSEDGATLPGTFELCHPGKQWEHDFDLTYTRVS